VGTVLLQCSTQGRGGLQLEGNILIYYDSIMILFQVFSRWTRTLFLGTVSRSLSLMEKRKAPMVRVLLLTERFTYKMHQCIFEDFHIPFSIYTRVIERGCPAAVTWHGYGSAGVLGPPCPPHGSGPLSTRFCACVGLQRQQSSGRQQQWRTGEHKLFPEGLHSVCFTK